MMGGYGALKIAFAGPGVFRAVVAMQPMLDPSLTDSEIGARNRLHHASGGPARLIGPGRDPALFETNNPANRARANAESIRASNLAIYIDAADNDMVNAHDGAEFLHRVLWDLDISHEYRLVRNADHGGTTFIPRTRAMFGWLSAVLTESAEPPGDPAFPTSNEFLRMIRARLQPLRDQAAAADPATHRRYGVIRK
jgi:S-formylglutathione hydrolase